MEQTVISADTHMDIVWLPEDLFVSNAPDSLKDKMPRVVETAEGRIWKAENTSFGFVAAGALTGSYEPYQPGKSKRLDRMEEMGFFSDADAGKFHPSTPELRLKDQDADGIKAEVIYGILGVSTGFSDAEGGLSSPEALTCVYDIYNQWATDFCKAAPDRLAALACISSHSPSIAAAQLKRAADLGLKGAEMNVSSASSPIYQDEWNELWETAGECNMPISFHTVGLNYRQPESGASERYETISLGLMYTLFQLSGPEFMTSVLLSGACDLFPNFKFVLGECGIGWLPYVIHRIDVEYEDRLFQLGLSAMPSELWRQHGYSTFQDEPLTADVIESVGTGNVLWGSDYPHADSVWPDSMETIERNLGKLDAEMRHKLVYENAGKLYGFLN